MVSFERSVLRHAIEAQVSDIYLTEGQNIQMRKDGVLIPCLDDIPTREFMQMVLKRMLSEERRQSFAKKLDIDFSWTFEGRRFRVNAYCQRGCPAIAMRLLPDRIPLLEEIQYNRAIFDLLQCEHGLILVCGKVGSGKTTTVASFLNALNHQRPVHILTLEDPVEYVFQPDKAFISQRELGRDVLSFASGLRSALREMPDVLLLGEIRDADSMRTALMAAESGMLVIGTLHTLRAAEAVMRMEGFFPVSERDAIRTQIASVLQAVFSQQLIPAKTGGRVCLSEVLLGNDTAASLIRQGKYGQISTLMITHRRSGMMTKNAALDELFRKRLITSEVRMRFYEEEQM